MRNVFLLLPLLSMVVLSSAHTHAEERPPIVLQGLAVGMSEAEVKMNLPGARCTDRKDTLAERVCFDPASAIADVPANVAVGLQSGGVKHVMVRFASRSFSKVASYLEQRYGPATSEKREPVAAKGGTVLENETRTWVRGDQRLYARKYHMKDTAVSSVVLTIRTDETKR